MGRINMVGVSKVVADTTVVDSLDSGSEAAMTMDCSGQSARETNGKQNLFRPAPLQSS
ncbi:hypothetical protein KIH87_12520 [Paraneptunicella aestuarii]|uniref:hypothetical protein n=1 Tax=Paraneptunicella aestuarii TaxID=2831148 RepID=UPI001E651E83|nr:hypothetical protein [Paraneptunicella aestuarii]UAA37535.1 hypothetical protein KIH87_12520 [Paraneptunicella aestuarii]